MNEFWTWRRVACELISMLITFGVIAAFCFVTGFYEYLEAL